MKRTSSHQVGVGSGHSLPVRPGCPHHACLLWVYARMWPSPGGWERWGKEEKFVLRALCVGADSQGCGGGSEELEV